MTLELQLKHYITNLFNLPRKENGNVNLSKKSLIISFPINMLDLVHSPTKSFKRILTTLIHFMKGIYTPLSSTIRNNLLRLVILMKQTIWTSYIFITQLYHY